VILPDWVIAAGPQQMQLVAEIATRAGTAKLDWPQRQRAVDYPQTDVHKYPGSAHVVIGGMDAGNAVLADDPADARGFLSSVATFHYASYGYLTRLSAPAPKGASEVIIRIEGSKGLSIYGEGMGRYGFDPVVLVHTEKDVRAGRN
jgi:hypothetical protein